MLALLTSMILWGTLGVFVLWSGLPAIDVAFYRCLIGVLLIAVWLIKSKESVRLDKTTALVASAGICLVLNWVFLFKSFQVSSITIGNISYYLQPIMLVILGIFIYQEKVSLQKWMLILLAMFGVLLTIDLRNLYSPNIIVGVLLALLAAFLYSLVTILMKNVHLHFYKVIFIQLLVGVIILLPFVHFDQLQLNGIVISSLLTIGIVHTLLAYFLYYNAIKKTNFTQIAVFSYLDPLVAIASDVIFFERHLTAYQLIGIAVTFLALYLLVVSRSTVFQHNRDEARNSGYS